MSIYQSCFEIDSDIGCLSIIAKCWENKNVSLDRASVAPNYTFNLAKCNSFSYRLFKVLNVKQL